MHGRYLISLLDKSSEAVSEISPHGTTLNLRVRQAIEALDFLAAARRWVVVPDCRVEVTVDGKDPVLVGFASPKDALVGHLRSAGHKVVDDMRDTGTGTEDLPVCVVQREHEGVTLAYAVRWAPYFHEWSFMNAHYASDSSSPGPLGTCVEGIRIDDFTPGFTGKGILALANSGGEKSPKTNVARSGLEATPERDTLLAAVYQAYCKHVEDEINSLLETRGHSLTWAIQEAHYLLSPLFTGSTHLGNRNEALKEELLRDAVADVRLHLIETAHRREAVSTNGLRKIPKFWTITCPLLRSAEHLIRETPGSASIRSVLAALGSEVPLPEDPIFCQETVSSFDLLAFEGREVACISASKEARRVDLLWEHAGSPSRWLLLPRPWRSWVVRAADACSRGLGGNRRRYYSYPTRDIVLLRGGVETRGLAGETALRHLHTTYFLGDTAAVAYARELLERELSGGFYDERLPPVLGVLVLFETLLGRRLSGSDVRQHVQRVWGTFLNEIPLLTASAAEWDKQLRDDALVDAIAGSQWAVLDPWA